MSKKFGVKKFISAALTAATVGMGSYGLGAGSLVSAKMNMNNQINEVDVWEDVSKEVPSELDADELISTLADEVWRDGCKEAVSKAGVKESEYLHDRGLAMARGVFTDTLLNTCYGKQKYKFAWKKLGSVWKVSANATQLKNVKSVMVNVLTGYFELDKVFKTCKTDILAGNRAVTLQFLNHVMNVLVNSGSELKNLPEKGELVLRNMVFSQIFGDPNDATAGGVLGDILYSKKAMTMTNEINKSIEKVNLAKNDWETRINNLKNSVNAIDSIDSSDN